MDVDLTHADGSDTFADICVLDLKTLEWSIIDLGTSSPYCRLSHSAALIGHWIMMVGGYDGQSYTDKVNLFNLVTQQFEHAPTIGQAPSPRGYATATLVDGRLVLIGGHDGKSTFDSTHFLELSSQSFRSRVINWTEGIC